MRPSPAATARWPGRAGSARSRASAWSSRPGASSPAARASTRTSARGAPGWAASRASTRWRSSSTAPAPAAHGGRLRRAARIARAAADLPLPGRAHLRAPGGAPAASTRTSSCRARARPTRSPRPAARATRPTELGHRPLGCARARDEEPRADRTHHGHRAVRAGGPGGPARAGGRDPYGAVEVVRGVLEGVPVAHVPRHGAGHARLSHQVTPRANVAALAACRVRALVSTTVCGAVDPTLELGGLVVFDDLHFPSNRLADGSLCTLFTGTGDPGAGPLDLRAALRRLGPRRRWCGGPAPPGSTCATAAPTATWTDRGSTRVSEIAQLAAAGVAAVEPDRGPRDGARGRGAPALRPDGLRDRPRQRRDGRAAPRRRRSAACSRRAPVTSSGPCRAALPLIAADPGEPAGFVFSL